MPSMGKDGPLIGVVGSGIAGLRAAGAVLKRNADARIVIFGDETHRTYNRPALTKRRFPSAESVDMSIARELQVRGSENGALTWRLGTRVESADLCNKSLHLSTGRTFEYDSLVIAAGVRPRSSRDAECECHTRSTVRGLDDAKYLQSRLQTRERVTLVGSGFVACEIASLAKEYGCEVVMLEALRHGPFEALLGEHVSIALRRWVMQNGVTFRTGDPASELLCDRAAVPASDVGALEASNLESSSDRSLLVEAIGSVPNVEWLHGNGLDLSDGVRVDEYMRVSGFNDVFAAGDIARYPDPWMPGSRTRLEFWKNAMETGDVAGRSLASSLGDPSEVGRISYFPSMATEVFGLRIQVAGNPKVSDSMEVVCGDLGRLDRGALVKFLREEVVVGVAYMDNGARFNSDYIEIVKSLKSHSALSGAA